jgi:predicted DNA-binding transcriptional regulator AlpA
VDTDGSPARRGMMSHMPKQDIALSEWALFIGVPIWTVRGWVKLPDFPPPARTVGNARLWDQRDLDRWKKRHPTLGLGRGGHMRKG